MLQQSFECINCIKKDGKLIENDDPDLVYTRNDYWFVFTNNLTLVKPQYCEQPHKTSSMNKASLCENSTTKYPEFFMISLLDTSFMLPLLFIVLSLYYFIPWLESLHGKIVISYIISVTFYHLSSFIIQHELVTLQTNKPLCSFVGYLLYISILSCFFWLHVMCYDVWFIA